MSPALFVSLPFILLLILSKEMSVRSVKPSSTKPSIETLIDLIDSQNDEIIIVCKKKR